ncbi:MAG TPA: dihydropteroate synthase [bacterium]|nr:dihydropteroate synthase [bacterium]
MQCGPYTLTFSTKTHVMGILNVTPDSFYDGGRYRDTERAVQRALEMQDQGADIIDIGGESTRPGADPVSVDEELDRVLPVIEKLSGLLTIPVSVDTRKARVAEKALEAGAHMVNDISGLRHDEEMVEVIAEKKVPAVIMHIRGTPGDMQKNTDYKDLMREIKDYLQAGLNMALQAGIPEEKLLIDPGIGFGKKWADNFRVLSALDSLADLGCAICVGVSRKSFIGWALDRPEEDRLFGTVAAVTAAVLRGAHVVRVHDVRPAVDAVRIADRVLGKPKDE